MALLLGLLWTSSAEAATVLFLCSDARAAELHAALDLELRGFGTLVVHRPEPSGFTSEAHAASALLSARDVDAALSLWIERSDPLRIRAVHAASAHVEEAPLPLPVSQIEPRTFAAIAGSVALAALGIRAPGAAQNVPLDDDSNAATAPEAFAPLTKTVQQANPDVAAASGAPPAPSRLADEYRPRSARSNKSGRVFATLGASFGMVHVRGGAPDRTPVALLDEVVAASRAPDGSLDAAMAQELIRRRGFDCEASETAEGQLRLTACTVAVQRAGYVWNRGIEGSVGLAFPRFSLALTARFAPDAGRGTLAHALLGTQLAVLVIGEAERGFFTEIIGGVGMGQMQARPGPVVREGPYARSGLGEIRGGVRFGYRFARWLGFYGGMLVHGFFPARVLALDPSFGLEVRQ